MTDLQPITPIITQAARHLGLSETDVIASAVTETEVVLVFRQGWKRRVPLSDLPIVSAETPDEPEPKAEPTVPDMQPEAATDAVQPEGAPDELESARPRRRRG